MNIRNALHLSTVAVVLAGGTSLMAQVTTGALGGQVVDEAGNPIAGAKVVLESTALFQNRAFTTDAKGEYRALLLPVGNYTVKVSASGKLGKTAVDVRVGLGVNLSLPFVLKAQVQGASATVEVLSTVATESKSDDKVAVNYSIEELQQIPGQISFNDITNMAPGVSGYGTGARMRGSETNQIMYRIDGINVKDDSGQGTSLYSPLPDSVEDVQVVLSALNARNGLVSGGQVNMVTKSGSNTFEGAIRGYMSRGSWSADFYKGVPATNYPAMGHTGATRYTDVTVSGPIIKDRLWFYVGARIQPERPTPMRLGWDILGTYKGAPVGWDDLWNGTYKRTNADGSITDAPYMAPMTTYGKFPGVDDVVTAGPSVGGGANWKASPEQARQMLNASASLKHYEGKLTGMVSDSHTLSLTLLYEKQTRGGLRGEESEGGDPYRIQKVYQAGEKSDTTSGMTLNWNGALASNWTIEARYSMAKVENKDVPNPDNGPSILGHFASSTPDLQLHGANYVLPHSQDWLYYASGAWDNAAYWYGVEENSMSAYSHPMKRGNNTISVNVKTFQELQGQHEIDMGFERVGTVYNYGRSKEGGVGIWAGGWYKNPAATDQGQDLQNDYLYPVFRLQNERLLILQAPGGMWPNAAGGDWNSVAHDTFIPSWWPTLAGPSARMEQYWKSSDDSSNSTTSFYVNDMWTINNNWNLMAGLRANSLKMTDSGGAKLSSSTAFEPRVQVKYNPDGKNKELYSFSIAKLSQAYSDQVANLFRGNEWSVKSNHNWTGANLKYADGSTAAQPSIDTVNLVDTPTGSIGGYTYTGTNMHGVRFVDHAALIDRANYGQAYQVENASLTNKSEGLKTPYAIEFNLSYQRNYETGYFKVGYVRRSYHDNIVVQPGAVDASAGMQLWGVENMSLLTAQSPDATQYYRWNRYFKNSEFAKTYQGIEINFDKKLTSRLTFQGSFTLGQTTGVNDVDQLNWKNLRDNRTVLDQTTANQAVGRGLLGRDQISHVTLTYVHPVGKGNVSASLGADYWMSGGAASITSQNDYVIPAALALPTKVNGVDIDGSDRGVKPRYNYYYGSMGAYRDGIDYTQYRAKIAAEIPIGVGKARLISSISINNVFNHAVLMGNNPWGSLSSTAGRTHLNWLAWDAGKHPFNGPLTDGNVSVGSYGNNGDGGRRNVGEISIGIKF